MTDIVSADSSAFSALGLSGPIVNAVLREGYVTPTPVQAKVWGITPSSAATTSTTMSVTLAPRARIAVNAA